MRKIREKYRTKGLVFTKFKIKFVYLKHNLVYVYLISFQVEFPRKRSILWNIVFYIFYIISNIEFCFDYLFLIVDKFSKFSFVKTDAMSGLMQQEIFIPSDSYIIFCNKIVLGFSINSI